MTLQITQDELRLLNFYRASELQGGLILGQLAQRVRDAGLLVRLTRHSAEEVLHAQYWSETIDAVGGHSWPTRDTYQSRYAAVLPPPSTVLDVLVLTQVFERTVYRHFIAHARRRGTHAAVRATLHRMLDDERDHLSWVKFWLDEQPPERRAHAADLMRRYADADAVIRGALLHDYHWTKAA